MQNLLIGLKNYFYNLFRWKRVIIYLLILVMINQLSNLVLNFIGLTNEMLRLIIFLVLTQISVELSVRITSNNVISYSFFSLFSKLSGFLFSAKNNQEVFNPIISDWQEEYFNALFKKEKWKAHWINVRYSYAFVAAMWQKSPIGDLIEFVVKIAKG